MKRTPMRRTKPLRPKRPPERASRPLRRSKPKKRGRAPYSPDFAAERAHVMAREGYECIGRRLARQGRVEPHECRNRWGDPQTPAEPLTVEHVKLYLRTGKRAPDHRYFMVAACSWSNTEGWTSANRDAINEYLDGLYGRETRVAKWESLGG